MNKTNSIKIRCTDAEKKSLIEKAKYHGMTVSDYLRDVVKNEIRWFSVDDRKPPLRRNILIYTDSGGVAEGERISDTEYIQYRWNAEVKATYWAEMPGRTEE